MIIRIERKRKGIAEFSKKCLAAMIVLWFLGAIFGFAAVTVQVLRGDMTVNLSDLLNYIGLPMAGGILGYMIKSAVENKEKILKGQNYERSENQAYEP